MKTKLALSSFFLAFCLLFLVTPVYAQSSIFEGFSSPQSLFEGLKSGFQSLFGLEKPMHTGGARIPMQPIAGVPTPGPETPSSPEAGDYLKLTLSWEALSTGPEKYLASEEDPLKKEHLELIHCPCGEPEKGGQGCSIGGIKHVLWGWCGQEPQVTNDIPVPPDLPWCEDLPSDRDPEQRCIPKRPAGPNTDTLENAISNKYIRRDGYLFQCAGSPICPVGENPLLSGANWNYVEFQTEIFHSNNFNLYLNVENQSTHPIENIQITFHPQFFTDEDLKQSLTHNVEYPIAVQAGGGWIDPVTNITYPKVTYQHAHRLDPFELKYLGGDTLKNLPPFEIGPFNLRPAEKKTFPLQDRQGGYCSIPTAKKRLQTSTSPQIGKMEAPPCYSPPGGPNYDPNLPPPCSDQDIICKCSRVEMHNFWQSDPPVLECGKSYCRDCPDGCPTIYACRSYYGIGLPEWGDPLKDDVQGTLCDNNCITVPGCPPPSCFYGKGMSADCNLGPLPGDPECDFDEFAGRRLDDPRMPQPPYRYYDCPAYPEESFVHLRGMVTPSPTPLPPTPTPIALHQNGTSFISQLTKTFTNLTLQEAKAWGCGAQCQFVGPTPTPTPEPGCFSLVPRDFNFVCDSKDDNPGEVARCSDDKDSGIYPLPTDDTGQEDKRFLEFRDVTTMGGCGYKASSDDSVIGPFVFEAKYGKTQSSRSVLLASIPIGGKAIDFEGAPVGWPVSGKISEDWGATQTAQELGPLGDNDYLYCPNGAKTYPPRPDGSTEPIGDYLHPGIDLAPTYEEETDINVYSTHAGWVTFAGVDPKSPKSGWTVQIESDVTQDGLVDYITRYEHLLPNSIQFDVQNLNNLIGIDGIKKAFGQGVYVARNAILGKTGDSGSPGQTQLHYEIIGKKNFFDPKETPSKSGDISQSICTNDPYIGLCAADGSEGFYFSKLKFYTPDGNPVKGPIYKNP